MELLDRFFPAGQEFAVTNAAGKVPIAFSAEDTVPHAVWEICKSAPGLLRIAGSTTNLDASWQKLLMRYVVEVFGQGNYVKPGTVIMSGGWRVRGKDGRVDATVLEVPQMVRQLNPRCRTLGSLPLTSETMCFYGPASSFAPLDTPGPEVQPNPGNDLLWVVTGPEPLHWNGDVLAYVGLMDRMRAAGKATGLLVFGGGGVTAHEIETAMTHGHPVAVAGGFKGFGYELAQWLRGVQDIDVRTENILTAWQDRNFTGEGLVELETPGDCAAWLTSLGLVAI